MSNNVKIDFGFPGLIKHQRPRKIRVHFSTIGIHKAKLKFIVSFSCIQTSLMCQFQNIVFYQLLVPSLLLEGCLFLKTKY